MFNEHQQAHMNHLATLPVAAKCGCQWYPFGECFTCEPERGGYIRCAEVYEPWPEIRCTRKAGHAGDHAGFIRVQCGVFSVTWTPTGEEGR